MTISRILFAIVMGLAMCFSSTEIRAQIQKKTNPSLRLNGFVVTCEPYARGQITLDDYTRVFNIIGEQERDTLERTLINESNGMFIGYSLRIQRLNNPTKLKVAINPLPEAMIEHLQNSIWLRNKKATNPALPKYPEPKIIDMNDIIEMVLWVNPATGATISDRIRFEPDVPGSARPFTLDEVLLRLVDHRLTINGERYSGEAEGMLGGLTGPLPYFYLPSKGRFIFSIQPHAGYDFQQIGEINENKIVFTYGSDKYEWISSEPILEHGGKWHLWVMLDKEFQPGKDALLYGALSAAEQVRRQ